MGLFGKSKYKKFKEAKQINRDEILSLYKSGNYSGSLICIERYIETYGIFTVGSYNPENLEKAHEVENEMRKEDGRRFLLDTEIIELKINCMNVCRYPKKNALLFLSYCQSESKEKLRTTNDPSDPWWYPSRGLSNNDYQQDESFIRRCTSEVSIWVDPKPNAEDIVSKETLKELSDIGEFQLIEKIRNIEGQLMKIEKNGWSRIGSSLFSLEKYEEAIKCYDEVIRLNPKDSDAWDMKGFSLALLEKDKDAITCYDEAIRINPENSGAWHHKGISLDELEKYKDAITCYDEAIRINPKDSSAWNAKGNSLDNLEKHEDAITCYDEAIRINPKDSFAWRDKGNLLKRLGRDEEAEECFAKVKELHKEAELEYEREQKEYYEWRKSRGGSFRI